MSAARHALDYIFGLGIVGFIWAVMNLVIEGVDNGISNTGDVYTLALGIWNVILVLYLLFGAFWLFRVVKEWQYEQGGLE